MATILDFPSRRETAGKARRVGPAKIIIFPGTRIERREFNLTDRTKPIKNLSKQSRSQALELDDR
ncbi:MAG TPA: hypothetical protein VH933_17510 [Aestuariivirgaceae bacterium]